jgi:hypothetical protein
VPEAFAFQFDDVTMTRGPVHVSAGSEGLTLVFDDRGLEIIGTEPGQRQMVPWSDVRGVWLEAPETTGTGRTLTPVDVRSVGMTMRFLIDGEPETSVPLGALALRLASPSGPGLAPSPNPPPPVSASRPPSTPASAGAGSAGGRRYPAPVPPRRGGGQGGGFVPVTFPPLTFPPGTFPPGTFPPVAAWAPPPRRRRRGVLVAGLALVAAGAALAVALSLLEKPAQGTTASSSPRTARPATSADQRLADRLMLTAGDLPVGWRADAGASPSGDTRVLQRQQEVITATFARCMGISVARATVLLGGGAPDRTAQTSSPVFVSPASSDNPGFTAEIQTAASIVRSPADQRRDLALVTSPRYPACAGTAVASELQLGLNGVSGQQGRPGPASSSVVPLSAPSGERATALRVSFTVNAQSTSVPVVVELVVLGSDRIEAQLQALAVDGPMPGAVVSGSVATFEQRVAARGHGLQL